MKKTLLFLPLLFVLSITVSAQVEIAKMVGKNGTVYNLGFGAFLKVAYPVSDAADITLEGGALIFQEKEASESGIAFVPVKIGYRYTLNGMGDGFYAEPQLGYNVYGVSSHNVNGFNVDENFHGVIAAAGVGYLFPSLGGLQFDLGLRYEALFRKGGSYNYIGLRLSHNFSFNRRESE